VQVIRATRRAFGRAWSALLPWAVGLLYVATAFEADNGLGQAVAVLLAIVMGAALPRRGARPAAVAAIVLAAEVGYGILVPDLVIPFAGLVALWALTVVRPPRTSLVGLAGALAVTSLNFFRASGEDTLFILGLCVTVWAVAEATRNRLAAAHEVVQRATSEEQARIARELHDVIAHSVSVIVVQAAAADDVFDTRPDQARAALRSIEQSGRQALQELRLLLSGLRPAGAEAPSAPQSGLDRLEELAPPLRAAGLDVSLRTEGAAEPLAAGVDLAAFRIVQEALTNTLRHARADHVEVTIRHHPDAVEVEVVDDGRGAGVRTDDGPGLGLVGMRERASVLGGTLEAGPTAHGGFRVRARLPRDGRP
jgi:signal transduction histidine kinase